MSGQWELVGKGKQGKGGGEQPRKLTKSQKNKFVQNAPKVEDILPLAQIKTLYTALDSNNKENRKPSGKENSTKENENKKAQKKPQPEKKKEVKEKPVIPKSLESAAKSIDVKELINEVRIGQARFQDAPLIWLKGLAEYLNAKLDHSNPKANDYPLSALSVEVRDTLKKALNEAGEVPVQHFFHICLEAMANDMSRGTTAIFGYKVMLQLMAFQSPSITVSNIPKFCVILNSYQNRQNIGHAILWAVAQGGVKDIQVGLEAWLKVMAPLIELKNYTSFVVGILNNILLHSPEKKPVPEEHFFGVLDVIHSSTVNLPNNKKQEFQTLSTALKVRTLKVEPEKHLRSFFEPLFQRLHRYGTSFLREELLECLVTCLSKDQNCFSVWRQLYTKHIPESTVLLRYIDTQWNDIKTKIAVKKLKETLSTFQVTNNEELRKGKHKHEQQLKSSQQLCEDLLKKMTGSKSFPWKLASFLVLTGIAGLLAYDIQKHGSFQSSSTRHFLNDVGALEYFEQAWARTKFYSNKSYRWAEANAPYYYKVASEYSKPYLQLAWDISLLVGHQLKSMYHNTRSYVEQKTPVVVEWINQYAPGLVDTVKTHSVQAWGIVKQGALFTWDNILQNSYSGLQWLKTNVFVGSLSPESLQKYSLEALNTTQVYAVWTYDWVCQKVQTLSKIQ